LIYAIQGLSAVGRYTVSVFGQYHVFISKQCSSWFGWIVTTAPVKTVVNNVTFGS